MEIVEYLCNEIGPRVCGSYSEYKAGQYIADKFRQMGLNTKLQEFSFLNWTLKDSPRLLIEKPEQSEIVASPFAYTLMTPSKGITGWVKKVGKMYIIPEYMEWDKYCILNESNKEVGYFIVNPNGPAIPVSSTAQLLPEPGVIIGRDDAQYIDSLLQKGEGVKVRLYNPSNFEVANSQNIIGILGEGHPQIVVCAHYDSVPSSPGAVDNASGVQAICNLAQKLISEDNNYFPTVAFIAMGGEELGLLGSRYYVKTMKENQILRNIKLCINFDMVGNGESIFLRIGQGIEDKVMKSIEKNKLKGDYEIKLDTAKASSDNWPFNEELIPNIQLVTLPFKLYHQPTDICKEIDTKILSMIEKIGYSILLDFVN